jgi:hypothetical protein
MKLRKELNEAFLRDTQVSVEMKLAYCYFHLIGVDVAKIAQLLQKPIKYVKTIREYLERETKESFSRKVFGAPSSINLVMLYRRLYMTKFGSSPKITKDDYRRVRILVRVISYPKAKSLVMDHFSRFRTENVCSMKHFLDRSSKQISSISVKKRKNR